MTELVLEPIEEKLFQFLMEVCKYCKLETVLRVAGGWVRDKLMGKISHDIDIALSDMGGRQFSEHVNSYLASQGHNTKTAGLIEANPSRKKHLEVATMKLFEIWVDFVNLRPDSYTEEKAGLGTVGQPKEDAARRDLTINSLFYNINERQVEDWTGCGLDDLKNKIIRTPIDPHLTFSDDPHRVLRAIRFATKFGFGLDDQLLHAAKQDFVKKALTRTDDVHENIARDRISTELFNILSLPKSYTGIQYLLDLNLLENVLSPRADTLPPLLSDYQQQSLEFLTLLESVYIPNFPIDLSGFCPLLTTADSKVRLKLSALLLPFQGQTYKLKNKASRISHVKWVLMDALRTPKHLCDQVETLVDAAPDFTTIAVGVNRDRLTLGMAIRKAKDLWQEALILGFVRDQFIPLKLPEYFGEILNTIHVLDLDQVW